MHLIRHPSQHPTQHLIQHPTRHPIRHLAWHLNFWIDCLVQTVALLGHLCPDFQTCSRSPKFQINLWCPSGVSMIATQVFLNFLRGLCFVIWICQRIQLNTHFVWQYDPFVAMLTLWIDPLVKSKLKYVGKKVKQVAPSLIFAPLRSSQAAAAF